VCNIFHLNHTLLKTWATWTGNWTMQSTVSTATTQLSQNLILQVSECIWIINTHTQTHISLSL
jgi:hypothetical protein